MPYIKLRQIEFSEIPFRKLKALTLPIADRITIIAGHNGTGKSTILAFLANSSGLSEKTHTSYFNKAVQANMADIVHLTIEHDFIEEVDQKPSVLITYDISGQTQVKKCNVTKRGEESLRVVPRNEPKSDFDHDGIFFSTAGKVPLPTIYLGMSRMIPIGESAHVDIQKSNDTTMPLEDRNYIHAKNHKLIDTGNAKGKIITNQSIRRTRKSSKHADYAYDSRAVSLGQDSLSSIVTALVSFKKLKREMADSYPGGLLIIDEIEAGFHPSTQRRLIQLLQHEARDLQLQIIATTHSLPVIEKIFADHSNHPKPADAPDVVHYLQNTTQPHLCEGWSLKDIRADMYLDAEPSRKEPKPQVILYSEDDEAQLITERIVRGGIKSRITLEAGATVKPLSIKMGCIDLMKLYKADKYFESVVIIVDADAPTGKIRGQNNIVHLPGSAPKGQRPTPELLLYRFFDSLYHEQDQHLNIWKKLYEKKYSPDYIRDQLLDDAVEIEKRGPAKQWFNEHLEHILDWGLIDLWIEENSELRDEFVDRLIAAIKHVIPKNKAALH